MRDATHFESEVESFLEGSHGDRTHIKRADHHGYTTMRDATSRVGLLLSGIALLGAAVHCLVASAIRSYLVHCCRI